MKKIYILRSDDDIDFVGAFTTLNKAIKCLEETLADDFIYLSKEEKEEIKERADYGFTYPYCGEDNPYSITWTNLE